ncbi:MAG TPA: TonB family protein [Candidatus Binatia bacterium]|nr:TonB family protein [Candidatus Binatia bacterium]
MKRHFATLLIVTFGASLLLAQEERDPVSVPEEAMQMLLIHRVDPVLPPNPEARLPGTVVLRAVISKSGAIESLQTVSGYPMLVPASVDAVRQWRYRHYEVNGIPVRVETIVRVAFSEASDVETETSAPQAESPIQVTAEDMRDRLVYKVAPVYPPLARQARIQGTVILRIVINLLGEVRGAQLVSGHPMLAPAAVEAVKKWKYIPYESEGKPLEIQTDVQVVFRLAGA